MTTTTERIRRQQRDGEFPLADALKLAAVALERLANGLCPHCGVPLAPQRRGRCYYCALCGGRYQA